MPKIKHDILESIDELILRFHRSNSISIKFSCEGIGDYSQDDVKVIIIENFKLRLLMMAHEYKSVRNQCIILLLLGVSFLVLSYVCANLFDGSLIFDVINIIGSLLIWTSGEKHFLDQSQNRYLRKQYASIIKSINH